MTYRPMQQYDNLKYITPMETVVAYKIQQTFSYALDI
jgi:hypothetical protein